MLKSKNMNKTIFALLAVVLVAAIWWFYIAEEDTELDKNTMSEESLVEENEDNNEITSDQSRQAVGAGTYTVDAGASEFNWSGKKPLIDGYTNSGLIGISEGEITVTEEIASGSFVLDMNTLSVGLTAKKPGSEGALEDHLKGERWFNVAEYPTAQFTITDVQPMTDSDTTFQYSVTGDLTMKGVTNQISFPATIYQTAEGVVYAEAATEIDRTKWGITAGSGNFFESLGDNVIDDMVAISFKVVANSSN